MNSKSDYSKLCIYGCGIQIYWNRSKRAYYEVETDNRHLCPNSPKPTHTRETRSTYYKKPFIQSQTEQQKAKMSNTLEILSGSAEEVVKQYEYLSDVINDCNGRTLGSQSHCINSDVLKLFVYYEVPVDRRELVKQRFNLFKSTNKSKQNN